MHSPDNWGVWVHLASFTICLETLGGFLLQQMLVPSSHFHLIHIFPVFEWNLFGIHNPHGCGFLKF